MEFKGFIGDNSYVREVDGPDTSKIYKNCRVEKTILGEYASIGDFGTVRECTLGERVMINRHNELWRDDIGRFSYVGRMSIVHAAKIGAFCALADDLSIGCDDHDYTMLTTHPFWHKTMWGIMDDKDFEKDYNDWQYSEPCEIGNDVWCGDKVTVCRNVKIGDGCVIGAGAIITRDLEPYSVVVGVNRVLKKRFSDNIIERLLKAKWWELSENIIKDNLTLFKENAFDEEALEKLEIICSNKC